MKKTNVRAISLLAVLLLSGTLVSLVAADDSPRDVTTPPEATATVDPTAPDADLAANSTVSQDNGEVLYTAQDNSTATDDTQAPGLAEQNQIATQTETSDNTLLIAGAAVAIIVALGAVGAVFYRKKAANAD